MTDANTAVALNRKANLVITEGFVLQSFALAATPGVGIEAVFLLNELENAIENIENYILKLTGDSVWITEGQDE